LLHLNFALLELEILRQFNFVRPNVPQVFSRQLMGKMNFHGYLILRFYPCKICTNFMHAKIRRNWEHATHIIRVAGRIFR